MGGDRLANRLGVREGSRIWLLEAPVGFARKLEPLPQGAAVTTVTPKGPQDLIALFAMSRAALGEMFPRAAHHLAPRGCVWAAWPRKSSGVFTDLTEELVRSVGLAAGLVDNKIISLDDIWAGLRFIFKERDRLYTPSSIEAIAPPEA
jgi:hypothetical protein